MTTTRSTTRQLLLSGLIIVVVLTAAIILDGPPTLTNKALAQGDASALAHYGYYSSCSLPHCIYMPLILRQLVH